MQAALGLQGDIPKADVHLSGGLPLSVKLLQIVSTPDETVIV